MSRWRLRPVGHAGVVKDGVGEEDVVGGLDRQAAVVQGDEGEFFVLTGLGAEAVVGGRDAEEVVAVALVAGRSGGQ
jgi:hypothetical protein